MAGKRPQPKPKRPPGKRYIVFEFWELECPAFTHLSADATRVYLFMRKAMSFDYSNNGKIAFSHRDAAKVLNSGWRRGSNALAELQHYGFIKARLGGQPGSAIRQACEWQLTAFSCGGQEASKDFMRWDGTVFEPPHTGAVGAATRQTRESKKQLPVFNMTTPRRQHEDGFEKARKSECFKKAESVFNMKTDSTPRRRQHEDTITITRERGANAHARANAVWPSKLRRDCGLSQYDLALAVGTSRGHIAAIEQGRKRPRPKLVAAITRALAGAATKH